MKIDIVIRDATPSELIKLLSFENKTVASHTEKSTKRKYFIVTKLKIPFPVRTAEYQKAWRLCKKYGGIPYMDALRESGALQINEPPKPNNNEPTWKEVIKNSANPIHESIIKEC
jgi:hypothetical protein